MSNSIFSTTPRYRSESTSIKATFMSAVAYWERRRVWLNVALALLAAGWVMLLWLDFRHSFNLESGGRFLRIAILVNLCYCAGYLVDIPLSRSNYRGAWQRSRDILWGAGTVFAILLMFYWIANQIDPWVR